MIYVQWISIDITGALTFVTGTIADYLSMLLLLLVVSSQNILVPVTNPYAFRATKIMNTLNCQFIYVHLP